MKKQRSHLTINVRLGLSDTFFTLDYHGRLWPVYLILERDTRLASVDQREPRSTPLGVVDGVWAWWRLGSLPSLHVDARSAPSPARRAAQARR